MNAYILIGGRSTRMGVSKTELFLDRVAAAARPVFEEVIAVQRHGGDAATITTIYEDAHEHDGAIFGVARALREVQAHAFILAVDYPFVTADVLRYLRDDGRVPIWDGRPQPLCAVWNASVLPLINDRIARGALDLHGLIDREMIPESELRGRFPGEPLRNVNTFEEWHG
ncbi:MAG: molybdenum cofactor guanylyltransferase [Thermoanaerobaculia bacterium]